MEISVKSARSGYLQYTSGHITFTPYTGRPYTLNCTFQDLRITLNLITQNLITCFHILHLNLATFSSINFTLFQYLLALQFYKKTLKS